MNNASAILRSLIIYAICVPVALWLGYLLSDSQNSSNLKFVGLVAAFLLLPMLLQWHYPLLLLSWNMSMVLPFLSGRPNLWLALAGVSLGISVLQRTVNKDMRFLRVPQVTWPLICLVAVVVVTAIFTGWGLKVMGSDIFGGKRYIYLLGAIVAYFALTARRIPPEQVKWYLAIFFLGGLTQIIGDLVLIAPSWMIAIFSFFPPGAYQNMTGFGITRLGGAWYASFGVFSYLLARYGIRGIFQFTKPWRLGLFIVCCVFGLFGGFRSQVMAFALVFMIQFYLEGLHRTKLLMILMLWGMLGMIVLIPLAPKLPFAAQRSLSFLPLNIDPLVKMEAQGSVDWRVEMWTAVLPEVPEHLLLGKGYAIDPMDYQLTMGRDSAVRSKMVEDRGALLAGDIHNGPLSLILEFGIAGVVAFVWFLIAGIRVLYANYRYGDPSLRMVNLFLLSAFIMRTIFFFVIFGGIYSDMLLFAGWLGLSVALNGGMCHPTTQAELVKNEIPTSLPPRSRLQPAFQRLRG